MCCIYLGTNTITGLLVGIRSLPLRFHDTLFIHFLFALVDDTQSQLVLINIKIIIILIVTTKI